MTIENDDDFPFFAEGEWVECKLNTNLMGIVISSEDWGRIYTVQLAGSAKIQKFYAVTLRSVEFDGGDDGDGEEVIESDSNVIDFTKERDLRTAKTRGAA